MSDQAQTGGLYPDTELYPDDLLYPDGTIVRAVRAYQQRVATDPAQRLVFDITLFGGGYPVRQAATSLIGVGQLIGAPVAHLYGRSGWRRTYLYARRHHCASHIVAAGGNECDVAAQLGNQPGGRARHVHPQLRRPGER